MKIIVNFIFDFANFFPAEIDRSRWNVCIVPFTFLRIPPEVEPGVFLPPNYNAICHFLCTNFFILQKQWEALIRRALCRASGEKPPRRGKNWKSKANAKENDDQNNDEENSQKSDSQKLELTNLIFDTLFVDTSTDLKSLFESHFGPKSEAMGLIGNFVLFCILFQFSFNFFPFSDFFLTLSYATYKSFIKHSHF